ncbi:hypothetical protein [Flavobacterium sp. N502536]|uniref:hypothetical protein n=1 Tax=Flavobacterium sp. N502536 TaxID=2986837 RepID=UPI0022222FA2|nr:hypothetical protein [Flavobacterium sp. N502536]
MNKKQWENLYNILSRTHSDFLSAYLAYRNGKNKKNRDNAERQVDNVISLASYHIRANWEVFELLTGGENSTGFGRAIIYDEFLLPRYFGDDMRELLNAMQMKIESFEE